jgi:hypothetical protein
MDTGKITSPVYFGEKAKIKPGKFTCKVNSVYPPRIVDIRCASGSALKLNIEGN